MAQTALLTNVVLARPPDSPLSETAFTPPSTQVVRGSSATGLAPVYTPNLTLRSTSPFESSSPVRPSSSRMRRGGGSGRASSSGANFIFPPVIPADVQPSSSRSSPGEETTGPTSSIPRASNIFGNTGPTTSPIPPASNIFGNWTQGSNLHSLVNRGSGGLETGDT